MLNIKSRFIEVPSKRLIKISRDFTTRNDIEDIGFFLMNQSNQQDIDGAYIRVELKVYQDEAVKINKAEIETILAGAAEVDIRIIRIPRENVRSAQILKLSTLRDKLQEMASLKAESVPDSILAKADFLENMPADQVMAASIAGGAA